MKPVIDAAPHGQDGTSFSDDALSHGAQSRGAQSRGAQSHGARSDRSDRPHNAIAPQHVSSRRRARLATAALATVALVVAGCGGSRNARSSTADNNAAGAGAGAAPAGGSAAGSAAAGSSGAAGGTQAASMGITGTPVPGDTLTVGAQAPATSVNPATVDTAFVQYTYTAYDSLTFRDSDGKITPMLAESWKYTDDKNTGFELKLRKGLTFSNGEKLDAAAVKGSLEYAKGAGGGNGVLLSSVTSITTPDPQTVQLKLSTPNPMLPEILSQSYGIGQIIAPEAVKNPKLLTVQSTSYGIGPYILDPKNTVAGDHYSYNANPDYYAKDARQHYKKIVIKVIKEPAAAINALTTKQIDVLPGDPSQLPQATKSKMQIVALPFVWVGFNLLDRGGVVSKPLGNVKVRQAMNFAVDRDTITKALLGEYGTPTSTITVPGGDGWSQQAADYYSYNVDKAKQLLVEAGYPNGFDLTCAVVPFAGQDTAGKAIAGQLKNIGINVTFKTLSDAQSYVTAMNDKKTPCAVVGYGAQPMWLMGQGLFLPTATVFNGFKTNAPDLVKLYNQAATASGQERTTLNQQMQMYLVENAWFLPAAFSPVFYFAQPDIGGLKVSASAPTASLLDLYNTK